MNGTRKSNLLGKITILFIICLFVLPAEAKYGGGTGDFNDPYLIYTAEQMNEIGLSVNSDDWDKHFLLCADIDLSAFTGTAFNIIGYWVDLGSPDNKPFTGVVDGNGHTISNFSYASIGKNYAGLFGYVDDPNAEIKNLGLIEPTVDAGTGSRVGSLVGWFRDGTMANCYAETASVSGNSWVGGLVGSNSGTITNCHSSGNVLGYKGMSNTAVGGLAGLNYEGTISNCYSTASVSGVDRVGCLVGGNTWRSTIINCCSTGNILGENWIGGLAGSNYLSTIKNCYSTVSVSGKTQVGGLVGYNFNNAIITNCYANGSVEGVENVGGLMGYNHSTVTYCYSTGTVSGESQVGGLVGDNSGHVVASFWDIQTSGQTTSGGGTPKTTDQMKDLNTFLYWGVCGNQVFWTINDGNDYPRLAWQNISGVPIVTSEPVYGGGSGNEADPYKIWTAKQLNKIGLIPCHWDKHFKLMADIDLSGFTGSEFNIIGYVIGFSGVFDGNGHTISNFTYTSTSRNNAGLFGHVSGAGAEIKNLGLIGTNVYVGTGDDVGSLVGQLDLGTISNCYVEGGSVAGDRTVGGLVGNNYGKITNCYVMGSVFGNYHVGGLVGYNENSIIDCYTSGNVTGSDNSSYIGGLCGKSAGPHHGTGLSRIQNCFSKATVTGNESVGGLIGHNGRTVTGCYSTGSVIGRGDYSWRIGGLIGRNGGHGSIINSYSIGSVAGDEHVGGLVGGNESAVVATIVASYWDIETSGKTTSYGGTGLPTAQMQMAITFLCWSYEPVWTIDEGVDYPRLVWENKPGELITVPSDLYGGGTGEPEDPYLIYTAEQLNMIGLYSCHLDKHFKLMADIDLGEFTETSFNIIGTDWYNAFTGVFDGNGRKIFNFIYTSTGRSKIGLFGCIFGPNAEVKNLGLIDPNVDAATVEYVGSLVGLLNYHGTITNCYVEGGSVEGDSYVGGLVGRNWHSAIASCYTAGSVMGNEYVGGLVGEEYGGTIDNSYSTCSASGEQRVGGLVGSNSHGTITNCYSKGYVTGTANVGGLMGYNWKGQVNNSFWDIETSGQDTSDGGTGLPTALMKWDFVCETANGTDDIWFISQQDYPRLWWEGIRVSMKLTPRKLNCRSQGTWVKAHLTLPQGFTVADVDSNRPAVLHSFGIESAPLYIFVNDNGLVQIEAAFERQVVCSLAGNWPDALTVAGFLADDNIFLGTSTVRIIHPGMKVIEELASCWLQGDCVHPTWCDGIDMNRDSLVNLLDYALLMNIEVEFVTDE
ncbi:MAG: GLUG motif-containing protein [Planctomycetota bacterium]|jgi:hypothetical protein